MKVKVETALFEVPFGSHLYGTNGPNSDLDFKVVCLPSIDTLLLNTKVTNRKVLPEGKKEGEKMSADEAEYEYIPLQVFLDDFFNGQTYALEIAFAVLQGKYEADIEQLTDGFIERWMEELVDGFLTRNVQKMVGYAVSQSRNYGLKTERYTSMRTVVETVEDHISSMAINVKDDAVMRKITLASSPNLVDKLVNLPHVNRCEILNASGGSEMAPAIEVCGKQFPLTASLSTMLKSLQNSLAQYGDRVKKYDGEGVDWKALSHAIRITEQVIELTTTGRMQFPCQNASYLKEVKEGKRTIEEATEYLTTLFNKIDDCVQNSILQERTPELEKQFVEFKLKVLNRYYEL